jgi:ubiquinone/menaquinone biosynthesis C-methylase UbiE
MSSQVNSVTTNIKRVQIVNDATENVKKYSKFGLEGTSGLGFRDIPALIHKYVTGNSVLDFGCGTGRSTRFLKSLNLSPMGVDISAKMLEEAKKLDPSIPYKQIGVNSTGLKSNSCDFIFSSYVLLTIPTKEELVNLLKELHRTLKTGGTLILITNSEDTHAKEMKWVNWTTDYPENEKLWSGKPVRLGNTQVGAEFIDFNWLDADYLEAFEKAHFTFITKHLPLGRQEDQVDWKSEWRHAPSCIYVLKK